MEGIRLVTHRLQCAAAATKGCAALLVFDAPADVDIYDLDPASAADRRVADLLRLNGRHVSDGMHTCADHRVITEAEYRAWVERRLPQLAGGRSPPGLPGDPGGGARLG